MASADLYLIGLNHLTSPIAVREKVALRITQSSETLQQLHTYGIGQVLVLSTCNRTEIYCLQTQKEKAQQWFLESTQINQEASDSLIYKLEGISAIQHLFRVACGLDSQVLGEPEILGQMKRALELSQNFNCAGTFINFIFQKAFAIAKDVRNQTQIGAQTLSFAVATLKIANKIFGNLQNSQILFIGAGEMIQLCALHFSQHHPQKIIIANRSLDRAQTLAKTVNAQAISLAELPSYFPNVDIVISCTASTLPIIGLGLVERSLKIRKHRPILIVDLALPRDVEPEVSQLDDIFLYTLDDLNEVIQSGMESRKLAAESAENLIKQHLQKVILLKRKQEVTPSLLKLRAQLEEIRQQELRKTIKMLANNQNPEELFDRMSKALINKWLHQPSKNLSSSEHSTETLKNLLHQLFNLDK